MNAKKFSKTTLILSALALGLTTIASASACDSVALEGTWTRFIPQAGTPAAGTRVTWTIGAATLDSDIALEDGLTPGGNGPYAGRETHYAVALDERACTLAGTANESIVRNYRGYDEPTENRSETKDSEVRRISYGIVLSADGASATFTDANGESFTMTRAK